MTTTASRTNAEAIRALRKANGWKQGKFAAAIGISAAYLCNIERRQRPGSPEVLRAIADKLGVPLAAITTVHGPTEVA